jgi:ribonuclease HII
MAGALSGTRDTAADRAAAARAKPPERSEPAAARSDPAAPAAPARARAEPAAGLHDLFAEAYRLRLLRALEEQLAHCGFIRIAGSDEVGRGALAGPVVAAAVILDGRCLVPGVDDSKCLLPPDRERVAQAIRERCLGLAVASVSAEVIDRINILEASRLAMQRALAGLSPPPDCAVIDAVPVLGLGFPCLPLVRGDIISYAVACASIIAKVERDRLMVDLGRRYPRYGFAAHKGYGVPEHLQALAVYGPCPEHRLSFQPVLPRRPQGGARRTPRTLRGN